MKRTVLAAALLAAFSMPALAGEAVRTDNASTTTNVDPVTTSATTTTQQSDIKKVTSKKFDCGSRKQALQMM